MVATAERLAAIGRVTAGVAHEIRNPIAAMRLKAENALEKGGERYPEELTIILEQIEGLDRLLQLLLNGTEPDRAIKQSLEVPRFLEECLLAHREPAELRSIRLESEATI